MPEISIIIPNYNTGKYISRCLDSLIHQTFKDIEIIVVDDGSTDNSVEIIKSYNDKRIHILYHKGNGFGPGGARNMGLEKATGKYIMFCDSDDWYEPDMCEKMYQTIETKKVDVVCCEIGLSYQEGLSQSETKNRHNGKYWNIPSGKYLLTDKRIIKTNVSILNKIWRHDLIEKYHIRFLSENDRGEDDAFWYMYATVSTTIYFLKEKLYYYFLRFNSLMSSLFHKAPKNPKSGFNVCLALFSFLKDNNLLNKYKKFIIKVFRNELDASGKFLSQKELNIMCKKLNKLIKNDLKSNNYLITKFNGVYLIDQYAGINLRMQLIIFTFKKLMYFSTQKEEKYEKYTKNIQQIKSVLKTI